MLPAVRHYPISVELYHLMAERGTFAPDERIELIDGEIIEMSPIGSRHVSCVNFLSAFLNRLYLDKFIISIQNPIVAADDSEPQPDLALLYPRDDFYRTATATGKDVALVIEVADSTAGFDRSRKFPVYAEAGIPEAWLVDLEAGLVEVHFFPKERAYGVVKVYVRGDMATSETMPDLKIPVNDILG